MQYTTKNIAIVIPTSGNKLILSVLKSIKKQTKKAGQIIVVQNQKKKFNFPLKITLIFSRIKSQIFQRSLAKKYLKKNIKIILQLDDYVFLKKNALEELAKDWNNSPKNTAGIGLNVVNYILTKRNLLHRILDSNSKFPGKVLRSGYVTAWDKNFFTEKPDWLNGGTTSWNLKYAKDLFKRKYPLLKWSVCEDVIYSYNKSKKFKLKLSKKAKAQYLPRTTKKSFFENFDRGLILSKIVKNFVIFDKELSLIEFYKQTIVISIFGVFFNMILFNFSYTGYFIARILGCFKKTYKFRIK